MVSSKFVPFNPRRWSSGIVKTMPLAGELRPFSDDVWTFAIDLTVRLEDLKLALNAWVLLDERLRLSMSPEARVLALHENLTIEIYDLSTKNGEGFAKDNPFLWQVSVDSLEGEVHRIEVRLRGLIGPDASLAQRLLDLIQKKPLFAQAFYAAHGPKTSPVTSIISKLLAPASRTSIDLEQEALWRMLRDKYPKSPVQILTAAVTLQALRLFSSDKGQGLLWEVYNAETLGCEYLSIHSDAEGAETFREILTSIEIHRFDLRPDYNWGVLSLEGEFIRKAHNKDFALNIFLNTSFETKRISGNGIHSLDKIQLILQKCLEAAVYDHKLDWTHEASEIYLQEELDSAADFAPRSNIMDLLEESFRNHAKAIALESVNGEMSFESIERASDNLAHFLKSQGHRAGELIGIGLPRDESMIVSMLAVLKIGAGYVPLDPAFPEDRLRYMAQDAKLSACLCEASLEEVIGNLCPIYRLRDIRLVYEDKHHTKFHRPSIDSEAIAYVIYTSGSTGHPKGVMLSHRSLVNFVRTMKESPGMAPSDKILAVTTLSFDIAVLEIFLPLYSGAKLFLATSEQSKNGGQLKQLLEEKAITHFQATASTFRLILDAGWKGRLKAALCGGEAFPQDIARRLKSHADAVWNMYGPTETTVWSSIYRLTGNETSIPIGRPVANTILVILDEEQKPLLPGRKGEIYIGGSGLALGYLGKEQMTRERFVYNRYLDRHLYRTGDIGLMRWDGVYEIFGRNDSQVKLRGYRMELGEIEAVMSQSAEVEIALPLIRNFGPEDDRLIAYVKARGSWNERDFRTKLKTKLPFYMLPQHYVRLDSFPLLPNGKIDRSALPHPGDVSAEGSIHGNELSPTSSQKRMLYVEALDEESHVHNLMAAWFLPKNWNALALEQALYALMKDQVALRMSIRNPQTQATVQIHDGLLPQLDRRKILSLTAAREFIEEESRRKIDISAFPSFRMGIVDCESGESIFYLLTHHIFWDGFSYSVFWSQLSAHYDNALLNGYAAPIAPSYSYADFIREKSQSSSLSPKTEQYWKNVFKTVPDALALATDYPRPSELTHKAKSIDFEIGADQFEAVQRFAKSRSVTVYHVLLSVYFLLLKRLTRQEDIVVGAPVLGRTKSEEFSLLGNFINALALRQSIRNEMSFEELVLEVKALVENATSHAEYPIERLVADLSVPRDPSRTPLYSVMFFFQDHSGQKESLGGEELKNFSLHSQTVDSDIVFWIERYQTEILAGFNYRLDLWHESSIEAMADAYKKLLLGFLENPKLKILDIALSSAPKNSQSERLAPKDSHLWPLLSNVAIANSDKIAVRTRDASSSMSYKDLRVRAHQIAAYLYEMGARPNDVIGISLSRGADLIPSLWAILSLGAAYLPLDPNYPSDRLQYMASDAKAKFLITEIEMIEPFRSLGIKSLVLDREKKALEESRDMPDLGSFSPTSLAYIIYTSGSTGRPKGVEIEHRAAVHFLEGIKERIGMTSDLRTLAITTISFDISVLEIFATLANGGEIILVEQDALANADLLSEAITKCDINLLQATPATWRLLLDSNWKGKRDLKALSGGEALAKDLAQKLIPIVKELWNVYGPTEATVWATAELVRDADDINIGTALPYYETMILDENRQPLPRGAIGDLYLTGEALARGYRFQEELSRQKFLPHPSESGKRIYDTGDLARYRLDGKIEYVSRRDNQVKLRGFRIELGEIEHSLMQHESIRSAVVDVKKISEGDSRLFAYLILEDGEAFNSGAIQIHLRSLLPSYMLPNQYVILEKFPLTGSGKIDKKALPTEVLKDDVSEESSVLPLTETEEKIAEVFRSILGTQRIRANETFFDAGGHSLIAFKAIQRFQNELGLVLTVRDLLLRTVAQIAHDLGREKA